MIETIVVFTLTVFFIHATFQEGMILSPVRNMIDLHLPHFITKPLYDCPTCMGVWYSAALAFHFQSDWMVIPATAGLCYVIDNLIHK